MGYPPPPMYSHYNASVDPYRGGSPAPMSGHSSRSVPIYHSPSSQSNLRTGQRPPRVEHLEPPMAHGQLDFTSVAPKHRVPHPRMTSIREQEYGHGYPVPHSDPRLRTMSQPTKFSQVTPTSGPSYSRSGHSSPHYVPSMKSSGYSPSTPSEYTPSPDHYATSSPHSSHRSPRPTHSRLGERARDSVAVTKERSQKTRMKEFEFPSRVERHRPPPLQLVSNNKHVGVGHLRPPPNNEAGVPYPFPGAPTTPPPAKRLAPLARYNPGSGRARSESLSSVIDDQQPYMPETPDIPYTPRSHAQKLRRMATVADMFSNINRQAEMLGMRGNDWRRP